MLPAWVEGKVIKIINETSSTKRFWIEVPSLSSFDFIPGQFVTLDLPIHEQKNKRWRSYSIASAPNNTNVFELVIVKLEGGAGTSYLFNQIAVGDTLTLRGPQGVFILPKELNEDLYLICTGTGVAPFRSMVHFIHNNQIPHKKIHLIFGCRKFEDSLYEAELKALEVSEPGFFYYPSFSREVTTKEGTYTGYVHEIYKTLLKSDTSMQAAFYICGWKEMIDEARITLKALGVAKEKIHFEIYG